MTSDNDRRYVHYPANTQGRDYVVGDIHGHFSQLGRLLAWVGFDTDDDRLFCVGDLIDRGPENAEAATFLAGPGIHAVRGNHEQMMLDALGGRMRRQERELWLRNGGGWHRDCDKTTLAAIQRAAATLPIAIEVDTAHGERIGIVHADVPGENWAGFIAALADRRAVARHAHAAIWSRDTAARVAHMLETGRADTFAVAGIDRVYHGHTPMPYAISAGNTRWVDTGVFYEQGGLSLVALDDDSVWTWYHGDSAPQPGWRIL